MQRSLLRRGTIGEGGDSRDLAFIAPVYAQVEDRNSNVRGDTPISPGQRRSFLYPRYTSESCSRGGGTK